MVPLSPRTDSRVVAAIERLDRTAVPIAETWRRAGVVADSLGLIRPSYQQVRLIVHDARGRGRRPTAGDVLLDIAFRTQPPQAVVDYLAGTG
ncbi:MAG TPA: hypothetical protein VH306_08625 [Gaiellaceae bacterium]